MNAKRTKAAPTKPVETSTKSEKNGKKKRLVVSAGRIKAGGNDSSRGAC